ncbi:MAG TPA: YceI family protein [Pyrinomonadaceae bacterium]|nr:YceI family protein [Pyrinomonadaceae bacterium]
MHRRTITIALMLAALAVAASATAPQTVTYTLDASRSKFMAHAGRSGLLWFKGHDHHLAASEFAGEVGITPQTITPASLRLVVKAASLHETGAAFTEEQKKIINKELRDIVLHPDQYPEITFQSTNVTAKAAGANRYEVKIDGNLTLHGVTRRITIPAVVTLNGDDLRAVGEFEIDRDDFKVKATSAFHGLVRVSDEIDFEFDIVARRR